jgi:hypothetical protein
LVLSSKTHASLNDVHIDLRTKLHAILELVLIVRLSSLALNVLLNGINLRLILNKFLFNIVQTVVNLRLQDLVFLGVMSHAVVSNLLRQAVFVGFQEGSDGSEANLLIVELALQVVSFGEFVLHVILHR